MQMHVFSRAWSMIVVVKGSTGGSVTCVSADARRASGTGGAGYIERRADEQ